MLWGPCTCTLWSLACDAAAKFTVSAVKVSAVAVGMPGSFCFSPLLPIWPLLPAATACMPARTIPAQCRCVMLLLLPVMCAVACRTVSDVSVRPLGLIIASISVVSSGMQQILCGTIQRQHKLQSHQLLANTAPVQGVMLLLVGPYVDKAVSGDWVSSYTMTTPGMGCLLLSCLISVGVNISQFMCLGRFSAVTFQVRVRIC